MSIHIELSPYVCVCHFYLLNFYINGIILYMLYYNLLLSTKSCILFSFRSILINPHGLPYMLANVHCTVNLLNCLLQRLSTLALMKFLLWDMSVWMSVSVITNYDRQYLYIYCTCVKHLLVLKGVTGQKMYMFFM